MDEIHHAAAPSYGKLLDYYKPEILLGITAAPERMDGKDILPYFNNRIVAEIRLPEAITAGLLCPFHLFRIADDTVDLRKLKWSAGGYDKRELSNAYTESGSISKRYCPTTFVQGALWLPDKQLDVFLITLRKEKKLLFHNYVQRLFHR